VTDFIDGRKTASDATALLGQEVIVTLDHLDDPPVIAIGKLLSWSDSGQVVLQDEMGFLHYCWPMLMVRKHQIEGECHTCADPTIPGSEDGAPKGECPESQRVCGHHCNCSWTQDHCHWCDMKFDF
jgi:hypothetical protein